ncbi:alpha/beta hydrolase family protein [Bremerella sp. JC770]|uniref:dienelactone hydrolase family protein n=1 Tax=Bremerella sp. JC770 TaxID=3232137 RepID=UPI00345B1933
MPYLISRIVPTVAVCTVLASVALSAEPPTSDEALQPISNVTHAFDQLSTRVQPKYAWNAASPKEHAAWKERMQPTIVDLLGELPDKAPLAVKWAEEESFDEFTRYKVYVRTSPDYWAPVYYFVPRNVTGKVPAIVCLHGHSGIDPYIRLNEDEKHKKKTDELELDYAIYMAKHGYVTAAIVVRGWNETHGRQDRSVKSPPRSCHEVTMNAFLMGMTPQGIRCWDAMRVIDFLQTRSEVDPERIGVAGLSGGGTLAMYLPILEPRVKLAMIAGAFSDYKSSIYSIDHCICNTLPGVMRYGDMADVVALVAPRPVLLINGIDDPIFPIDGAREGYQKLKQVYGVLDCEDAVDADFFEGGHAWSNNKTLEFLKRSFGSS